MGLDMYWVALIALLPTVVVLTSRKILIRPFYRFIRTKQVDGLPCVEKDVEAARFRRTFLQVYLLVMGSEWLQGPYMYTLLRDEKALSESTVASLYATTYTTAAVSALFTGFLADRYGRRLACLVCCLLHSLSCLTVLSSALAVIYGGRVLAGISLTLLWTVFESWMVTEFNARGFASSSLSLSSMFGVMTTSNCMAAILGGVLGHCIVLALGSRANPFLVGIVFEAAAVFLMLRDWNENFGVGKADVDARDLVYHGRSGGWLGDLRLWMLAFISCFFEGTNFLVLFFWPGMLQDAHRQGHPGKDTEIPYGVIFATFMAAMILGALLFNVLTRNGSDSDSGNGSNLSVVDKLCRAVAPNWLLAAAISVAGSSLLALAFIGSEWGMFCTFLLFEVCNGVYVPSIAYQRGVIVDEGSRTGLYALMKIPLFVFVVWSLDMTAVDDRWRRITLLVSAGMMLLAAVCSAMLRHGSNLYAHQMMHSDVEFEIDLRTSIDEKEYQAEEDDAETLLKEQG